jgi:hypothetical protein
MQIVKLTLLRQMRNQTQKNKKPLRITEAAF